MKALLRQLGFMVMFVSLTLNVKGYAIYREQSNSIMGTHQNIVSDGKVVSPLLPETPERPSNGDKEKEETARPHVIDYSTFSARSDVLYKIEQETGVSAKHLYAICMVESRCYSDVVGDSGHSLGAFQIHQLYNPGTVDIALDFERAARWTADRLLRYGYQDNWEAAVQCHNGCNIPNTYMEKIKHYL